MSRLNQLEFHMWHEILFMECSRFSWGKVFDCRELTPIPDTNPIWRNEARILLNQWLDDEFRKIMFREQETLTCLTELNFNVNLKVKYRQCGGRRSSTCHTTLDYKSLVSA